eukprot:1628673-Amphidinium_carterae.1
MEDETIVSDPGKGFKDVNEDDDEDVQIDRGNDHKEKKGRNEEGRRRSREKKTSKPKKRRPSPPNDPSDDEGSDC